MGLGTASAPARTRRRYSLGAVFTQVHAVVHGPTAGSKLQVAARRIIRLQRLLRMLKSRNRRQVERACERILDFINAPQNSEILHDLEIEPVLLSLLSLDPLAHWKIVGYALHGLFTLSINPKCGRVILQCDEIDVILEQYLRSERILVQRLTAGIICRVFNQPLQEEWRLFTTAHTRMVILLLSLLDSNNATVQLEALCVCNELTFHVDNTVTLCKREDFMLRISELVMVPSPKLKYLALQVLRNVVANAQVHIKNNNRYTSDGAVQMDNVILRAVRSVAKDLEKGLLQQLESFQEILLQNVDGAVEANEQPFIMRAQEIDRYQMIVEILWFIGSCFSRLSKDSVQPEENAAEFQAKLKQSAARFVA